MKKVHCYIGQVGDNIEDLIPSLIATAKVNKDGIFLIFNGVPLHIHPDNTKEDIMKLYNEGVHMIDLLSAEKNGELIRKSEDKWKDYRADLIKIILQGTMSSPEMYKMMQDKAIYGSKDFDASLVELADKLTIRAKR